MATTSESTPESGSSPKTLYAVVTGASPSSIGFLAAKGLAATATAEPHNNYVVILACRNEVKGKESEELIRKEHPDAKVQFVPLDLASRTSIEEFCKALRQVDDGAIAKQGLSILINNAGVGWGSKTPYRQTQDGLEEIVGVNHFGTFYLTYLLLEDLKRATTARVVIVSSSLHDPNAHGGSGNPDEPNLLLPDFPNGLLQADDDKYDGAKAYRVSKLCNLWCTYELQRQLNEEGIGKNIQVNAISPGFIPTTGLTRQMGWLGTFFLHYVLDPLRYLGIGITRSPEDGANVMIQAATSDVASKGGDYFELPKGATTISVKESSAEAQDVEKGKQLWELSLKTCQLK